MGFLSKIFGGSKTNSASKPQGNYNWGMVTADKTLAIQSGLDSVPVTFTRGGRRVSSNGAIVTSAWLFAASNGWRGPGIHKSDDGNPTLVFEQTMTISNAEAQSLTNVLSQLFKEKGLADGEPEMHALYDEIIQFLNAGGAEIAIG